MKISIIGVGKVGSSLAYVLSLKNFIRELVLVGRNQDSVRGDVLDLRHGQLFSETPTKIIAGRLEDTYQSDIIALCASVPTPKEIHSRLELAKGNIELLQNLLPKLVALSPESKIVMVSNPVDVLVYYALQITGFPPNRIMGTGTLVDSARFRQLIAEEVQIHMEDIHAYILGEHGDSQFPAMSCADAGGEPLEATPKRYQMAKQAATAGLEIFRLKGYTNYTIALAAAFVVECIATDSKHTMPLSLKLDGYLGIDDVCLSLPAVVGNRGIERILHPKLNTTEEEAFRQSASVVRNVITANSAFTPKNLKT